MWCCRFHPCDFGGFLRGAGLLFCCACLLVGSALPSVVQCCVVLVP